MPSRREFLQSVVALAALLPGSWSRAFAQQRLRQDDLLQFDAIGNVTLVHIADLHAQLLPVYLREPTLEAAISEGDRQPPHAWSPAFLRHFGIEPGSAAAYALTGNDFVALARAYGRMGGLDRIATVVNSIRAERGERVLLLDGGDAWQNSYTSMVSQGQDVIDCMALLEPDAMVGHWEFTLGSKRVSEIAARLGFPFLGQNIRDTEWNEAVFEPMTMIDRGGVKVAVIGQAFPYVGVAHPRWMLPEWSFGIREETLQTHVRAARQAGAGLVVLLSHNGLDVDQKLATRLEGVDVILTGHTHDAFPQAITVGKTLLVASGSHGKFVSRLDLDVRGGEVRDYRFKLIPILSDAITPDPAMQRLIQSIRAPHQAYLAETVGRTGSLLYRHGTFNGTLDNLICDALRTELDAEIALSPGFRWATSLLPGQDITRDDIFNATAITYPGTYRASMTGTRIKQVLEDVCDNFLNADPYYRQGGDMVRVGGLSYALTPQNQAGSRISDLTLTRTGKPLGAEDEYTVAGWARVNEAASGPPIWDVVMRYIGARGTVTPSADTHVRLRN
jgi:S-sulfosulfanyl-L-cysteine sulfohydrolase